MKHNTNLDADTLSGIANLYGIEGRTTVRDGIVRGIVTFTGSFNLSAFADDTGLGFADLCDGDIVESNDGFMLTLNIEGE